MYNRYDGRSKRRVICAHLGWAYNEFPRKIWEFYVKDNSASDVCGIINIGLPKYMAITPRSIQRIVKRYAHDTCQLSLVRTGAEGFKLKVAKGEVNWAYKRPKARKNNIGSSKRYEVLKRDNFACVLCGATAKEDLIEVDHITAIVDGGSDEMANLRVLCNQCNVGKRIVEGER